MRTSATGIIRKIYTDTIIIDHPTLNKTTVYGHILPDARLIPGQLIGQGVQIGRIQEHPTPGSGRPHLHFMITEYQQENSLNRVLNPTKYIGNYRKIDINSCVQKYVIDGAIRDGKEITKKCGVGVGFLPVLLAGGAIVEGGTTIIVTATVTASAIYTAIGAGAVAVGAYVYSESSQDKPQSSNNGGQVASQPSAGTASPPPNGGWKPPKKEEGVKKEPSAGDLIPGRLKKSSSFHTSYINKTISELEKLAKGGDQKAKQMLKLIKEAKRLMEKLGSKSK